MTLTWEDLFAIALPCAAPHATVALEDVSLEMVYRWTLALPGFEDDPALVNEAILNAIVQEWLEEANPL